MKANGSEKILPGYRAMDELLHAGEREAQSRFGVEGFWNVHNLNAMFHETISAGLAKYIEGLPFFFLATSNMKHFCRVWIGDTAYLLSKSGAHLPASGRSIIIPESIFEGFSNAE